MQQLLRSLLFLSFLLVEFSADAQQHHVISVDTSGTYTIFQRARQLSDAFKMRQALVVVDSAISEYTEELGSDHIAILKCLELKAIILIRLQHYTETEQVCKEAISLGIKHLGNKDFRLGYIFKNLAIAEMELNKYDAATSHLQRASYLFEQDSLAHNTQKATILIELGILHRKQFKSDEAINYYLLALDEFTRKKEESGIAKTNHNLGNVYFDLHKIALARRHYKLAEQRYGIEQNFRRALAMEGVALTYRVERAYDLAIANLMVSLDYLKGSFGLNHRYTQRIIRKIGQDYSNLGNYKKALEFMRAEQVSPNNTLVKEVMANCYLNLDDFKQAEKNIKEALSAENLSLIDSIFSLRTYGDILLKKGQLKKAEKVYKINLEQRKSYYRPNDMKIQYGHFSLAKLTFRKNQVDQALEIIDTLLASPNNMTVPLENGKTIRSSIWDDIMRKKCKILFSEYLKTPTEELWNQTLTTASDYLQAIDALRQNAVLVGSQLSFGAKPSDIIEIILSLLSDQYEKSPKRKIVGQALIEMDHVRDRLWVDLIQNRQTHDVTPNQLKAMREENRIRKEIASLELIQRFNPDSVALKDRLVQLKDFLLTTKHARIPKEEKVFDDGNEVISKLQSSSNTTLSFYVSGNYLYRIFVSADVALMHRLEWNTDKRELIQHVVSDISSKEIEYEKEIEQLSAYLLGGLTIPKNVDMTIYPDDVLHMLPFEILSLPNQKGGIIDHHGIAYSSSIKKFFFTYDPIEYDNDLVAFAPAYSQWDINESDTTASPAMAAIVRGGIVELPATKDEVESIANLISGKTYFDSEATVENFISQGTNSRILHMSMHALAELNQPNLSRLVFSPDENGNPVSRYCFAGEIAAQSIPAEMVVLSACNTGRGEFVRGDGVLSLARAFEYAGAKSTVYSLWRIPDGATREIMEEFYRQLVLGTSKTEALQTAKLKYKKKHSDTVLEHPFYWAGFVISGDTNSIEFVEQYGTLYGLGALFLLIVAFLSLRHITKRKSKRL